MRHQMALKGLIVFILVWIRTIHSSTRQCFTSPVAEGQALVLTHTGRNNIRSDELFIKSEFGNLKSVARCNPYNELRCSSEAFKDISITSKQWSPDEKEKVTVVVNKVNRMRDQTTWSWHDGKSLLEECHVDVYSFQSPPVCDDIRLSSDGKTVFWTCTVNNVYPDNMECQFKYRKESNGSLDVSEGEKSKTTIEGQHPPRTVYHNYTCTFNLPISQISDVGTYQFQFDASLVLGSEIVTKRAATQELKLALPRVKLVDCPSPDDSTQGYIIDGTTRTCRCSLAEVGNPPGVPQWLDSNGVLVGEDVADGAVSLSLYYNDSDSSPNYTCRGLSTLGAGKNVTYFPRFFSNESSSKVKDLVGLGFGLAAIVVILSEVLFPMLLKVHERQFWRKQKNDEEIRSQEIPHQQICQDCEKRRESESKRIVSREENFPTRSHVDDKDCLHHDCGNESVSCGDDCQRRKENQKDSRESATDNTSQKEKQNQIEEKILKSQQQQQEEEGEEGDEEKQSQEDLKEKQRKEREEKLQQLMQQQFQKMQELQQQQQDQHQQNLLQLQNNQQMLQNQLQNVQQQLKQHIENSVNITVSDGE